MRPARTARKQMKAIKNFIRRTFFNPFGYDIVPLKASPPPPPRPAKPAAPPDDLHLYEELYGAEAIARRAFYNVGAGQRFNHPAWTRIDHSSKWYDNANELGLDWDLLGLAPLPIAGDSAYIFYSSYVLEHITDKAAQNFLNEARRALRPGGTLRILVPDMDIFYRAWRAGERHLFWHPDAAYKEYPSKAFRSNPNEASLAQNFLYMFASNTSEIHPDPIDNPFSDSELEDLFTRLPFAAAMDACLARVSLEKQIEYSGNHINWYNAEKLLAMFGAAGFSNPYRSGYLQSASPVLRNAKFFDVRQPEIGLYIEAIKSG